MLVDSESAVGRPIMPRSSLEGPPIDERRNLNMYDAGLQRGLTRLDINYSTPPRDSAQSWAIEANKAVEAQAEQVRMNPPTVRFEDQQRPYYHSNPAGATRALHQHTMSAPSVATSREIKRHGWYHGPVTVHRDFEQQPHDPRMAHVDRIVHPNFNGFNGFPAREQRPQQHPQAQATNSDGLGRLEALVAVATSEGNTAAAF